MTVSDVAESEVAVPQTERAAASLPPQQFIDVHSPTSWSPLNHLVPIPLSTLGLLNMSLAIVLYTLTHLSTFFAKLSFVNLTTLR